MASAVLNIFFCHTMQFIRDKKRKKRRKKIQCKIDMRTRKKDKVKDYYGDTMRAETILLPTILPYIPSICKYQRNS